VFRLTYFDAGDNVQVYNSLWYPNFEYDLPMLGIDLISLGKSRVLSVIDFQPLHPTEEYSEKYISHLSEIRNKYPGIITYVFFNDLLLYFLFGQR
jgi:15,16-dihydrobiliverdin:ferredoxin oxidoreductase